jgi:hypothetical protein
MLIEQALRSRAALMRATPTKFCEDQKVTLAELLMLHLDICGQEHTEELLKQALAGLPEMAQAVEAMNKRAAE